MRMCKRVEGHSASGAAPRWTCEESAAGNRDSKAKPTEAVDQASNRWKDVVPCGLRPPGRPGRSLEQKIRVLVRRYRAAQRRRKQREAAGSKRLCMAAMLAECRRGYSPAGALRNPSSQ